MKIKDLNPFLCNWKLKVKAINKKPIHIWRNEKSTGKLFTLDLLDNSGQIRKTAFNNCVNKFFDRIENNKVYFITSADLKAANKKFTSIANNFELFFNNDTEIVLSEDHNEDVPLMKYEFSSISNVKKMTKNSLVLLLIIWHML